MRRCMVVAMAVILAACGGDSTRPEPFQGFPCEADVAAAIAQNGEPAARTGSKLETQVLTFVQDGDTTVYTFIPHYDATYWCEVKIQL